MIHPTFLHIFIINHSINLILSYPLEENDYYFQLYPSENKERPEEINFFTLKSEFYTISTTDAENMKITNKVISNETPIKNISSIMKFDNKFLIKTCFGPDKIIEIKDENSEIFRPNDDYFKRLKKNLENIKYCYSTALENPIKKAEYLIVTYWTESSEGNGAEIYSHKFIIFNPLTKTYGSVHSLDTQGNNFYAQSCTNLLYKYIYCTIDPSISLSKNYHFSIASSYLLSDLAKINLVTVLARFSNSIYHKPIGIFKQTYTNTGKIAEFFLAEYHDKSNNKTRLMTSLYMNYHLTSFILRFEDLGIYYGINIEDLYIEPNLFNYLLPNNEEFIIIYIKKEPEGKNLLLLNRYDYQHSSQTQTKFERHSLSNYLREDICENPKYMQSMFITPLINYDANDKQIIESHQNEQYYKYQRDIGVVISCAKNNRVVEYETKKIAIPQCLNILDQINGIDKNNLFTFTQDKVRIVLDINNNPNLRSLRNVEIQFFDSNIYNKILIVLISQDGKSSINIERETTIFNPVKIEFFRTMNFKIGKTYKIPYRIKQIDFSGISSSSHLTSDYCYFEFYYEGEEENDCTINYCKECVNNICMECNEDIIGIKLDKDKNECICNEDNGFNKFPKSEINMCVCKKEYSFYEDIKRCLPDFVLNSGPYCITGQDELSSLNIYSYIPSGMAKYYKYGLPYCRIPKKLGCDKEIWFKLGEHIFYSAKIDNCIYIIYNNKIVMYSNRYDCEYIYYDYKNCFNIDINNEEDYYAKLNDAYEYIPDDNNGSLIIKEDNITFYILNPYTSKSFSSVQLSPICIEKVKEAFNLPSILIFIANLKKKDSKSTQVEYSFFNSVPEFMNQELNISSCNDVALLNINNTYDIPLEKRQLQFDLGNNTNNFTIIDNNFGNYILSIDDIIIYVQINWTEIQKKIIEELYNKREINIFNSSIDFYNDVCNMFTTPENTDMYLQERRNTYYISDAICETGCVQIGYDKETERAVCKCKIKVSTEGFENVTFSPNEVDKKFKKKFIFPNVRVMKCILKNWMNSGFVFALILLVGFVILNIKRCCQLSDINHKIKDDRKIYKWEEPFEELKGLLLTNKKDNENGDNNTDGEISIIKPPPNEEEGIALFRCIPKKLTNDSNINQLISYSQNNQKNQKKNYEDKKTEISNLINNYNDNDNNINNDSIGSEDDNNINNEISRHKNMVKNKKENAEKELEDEPKEINKKIVDKYC